MGPGMYRIESYYGQKKVIDACACARACVCVCARAVSLWGLREGAASRTVRTTGPLIYNADGTHEVTCAETMTH